jgi:hypothetical protein
MVETRSRAFSKLAKDIDTTGNITSSGIASTVDLGGGVTVYASAASLPVSGNTAGDQAFVTGTGRLYIFSGVGWYNIALINNTPIIQSVLDSDLGTTPFILANDGTATTITITAVDSDGETITYASSADSDFSGLATISQSNNVFTITPFSQDSATTASGTITFTATDGINTATSATQTFTLNFLSALWDETVLSIGTSSTNSLDNLTFIDRSTSAHTVTATGSPVQTAFHPYLDNWSVEFDGVITSVVSTQAHADFTYGTGDFTIEWWAWSELDNKIGNMVQQRGTDGPLLRFETNHVIRYFRGNGNNIQTGTTVVEKNKWNHFAMVRNSGTMKIYINGVEELSFAETYDFTTSSSVIIGHYVGTEGFVGYIADVRIVKGTAVYTTAFTPPTAALTEISGTSLLASSSNRFIDNSSANHTLTSGGTAVVSAFNPYGQESEYAVGENKGSLLFDGSNDYLTLNNDLGGFSSSGWTFEAWVYLNDLSSDSYLISQHSTAVDTTRNISIGSTGFFAQIYRPANDNGILTYDTESAFLKQWGHLVIQYEGSGVYNFYVNGELIGQHTDLTRDWADTDVYSALAVTQIGIRYYNTPASHFNGYMADVRISPNDIVYSDGYTVPTAPVGNTNAALYLPMDNAGIFDKTGNNTINPNSVVTQTSDTVYASSTMSFNGSTFIRLESPLHQILDNEDFTLEFHVKITENETRNCIFGIGDHSGNDLSFFCQDNGYYKLHPYGNYSTAYNDLWDDEWHHFAISRGNDTLKAFIDGTQVASHASTNDYGTTAQVLNIGYLKNFNGYQFQGYIENFQFIRGVAKYTANFTAPTQEQGRGYQAES